MLQSEEKAQVEQYVTKICESIFREAEKYIQSGMSDKQVIDRIITITVNKFTPESKMILSSVYNMMMERTLAKPIYQITRNRAAFFELNILKELNSKFLFDVPNRIDYEESRITIDKWIADGVIVVAGGVISFLATNPIPIGMAVIVAAVMLFILKNGEMINEISFDKTKSTTVGCEVFDDSTILECRVKDFIKVMEDDFTLTKNVLIHTQNTNRRLYRQLKNSI